jgi:hypothetical protein
MRASVVGAMLLFAFVGACGGGGGGSDSSKVFEDFEDELIFTLTGSSTTTEPITLEEGMMVMHAESDGGFFAVKIVQDTGSEVMFNEGIEYSGSNSLRIIEFDNPIGVYLASGPAILEITSSGEWEITYAQVEGDNGVSSDLDISGTLDYVEPSINFKSGDYSITATTDKEQGHFSVKLIRRDGMGHKLLVNETVAGTYTAEFEIQDEKSVVDPEGLWTLDIDSLGDWEVSIK